MLEKVTALPRPFAGFAAGRGKRGKEKGEGKAW